MRSTIFAFLFAFFLMALPACSSRGDGTGSPDASPTGGADAAQLHADAMPGGPLKFMDTCDPNNDLCDSANGDVCKYYQGAGQAYCTHSCTMPSDCPPPSPGCNNMGLCKRPQ